VGTSPIGRRMRMLRVARIKRRSADRNSMRWIRRLIVPYVVVVVPEPSNLALRQKPVLCARRVANDVWVKIT
jgi:hypothetical protein